MAEKRICVGAIAGAHGVRGEVRIKPFTETPDAVAAYGDVHTEDGSCVFKITRFRIAKGMVIAALDGVKNRNQAEELKGTRLYVSRENLPVPDEDEFYHTDLIGLSAELDDGSNFGEVIAVHDFGAGDILEIRRADGEANLLLPFTVDAVPRVDLAKHTVFITLPEEIE